MSKITQKAWLVGKTKTQCLVMVDRPWYVYFEMAKKIYYRRCALDLEGYLQ